MKKVLEDELMSLAHRILKLKNRADIHELKEEAAVLYEKLSILSFAEKHFDGVKPTIKKYDIEKSLKKVHHEEENSSDYPDGTQYNEEQIYEHNTEKIKDIVSQMPYESSQVDKMFEDEPVEDEPVEDEPVEETPDQPNPNLEDGIQDFGVHFDDLPDFEPAQEHSEDHVENQAEPEDKAEQQEESKSDEGQTNEDKSEDNQDEKPQRTIDLFSQSKKSLNDSLNKELKIGLNDRLSFIKHLFKGDNQAYAVFIKDINHLDSFEKVKIFLDKQIQDKYAYWKDKEETANRLLYLIQKKFE
jgi:hypothetical protein